MADLKAYYECEIQTLREKLNLRDLPQEVEKANQALTKRRVLFTRMCAHKHSVNTSLTGPNLLIRILNLLQPLFLRRCKQLDKALAEATFRIQELEGLNGSLEKKLVPFPQTFFFDLRRIVATSVKHSMCFICWCDCLKSRLLTKL